MIEELTTLESNGIFRIEKARLVYVEHLDCLLVEIQIASRGTGSVIGLSVERVVDLLNVLDIDGECVDVCRALTGQCVHVTWSTPDGFGGYPTGIGDPFMCRRVLLRKEA